MGFSFRKGFNFGPLRLNLSRSGLGASFGVTGARIGVGLRGSYVHVGRGGLYYRQSLGAGRRSTLPPSKPARAPVSVQTETLTEIESGDVAGMRDASANDVLAELNRVQRRPQFFPISLGLLLLLGVGLLINQPPWLHYAVLGLFGLPTLLLARHVDVTSGTALLAYHLDPDAATQFADLKTGFSALTSSDAVWHLEAAGHTSDWKRNAGAQTLVRRKNIRPSLSLPPRVVCGLTVPTIPCGRQTLYFFPDRLFVFDRRSVGVVPYAELRVEASNSRFREDGSVPRDATQVGTTWKFVNRSGGPDKRFNNNRELPILLYGEVAFKSASGLNELIECSRSGAAGTLVNAMTAWQGAVGQPAEKAKPQSASTNGTGGWYVVVDAHDAAAKQRATAVLKEIEAGITEAEITNCVGGGHASGSSEFSLERANALMRGLESAGIGARKYRAT